MRSARPLVVVLAAITAAPAVAQRVPDMRIDRGGAAGASESWRPDLAVSGAGVHVTWMDYRAGDMDIWFNRSADGGASWLPNDVRLDVGSGPGAAWSASPKVAVSGSTVVVCWQDFRNGTFPHVADIYCNRSLDGGQTWLANDVRVNRGPLAGTYVALNHAVSCVGNSVFVTWEDQRDGGRDVYFNRSADGGATWLPGDVRIDVGDAPGASNSTFPRHAVSGTDVHVIWSDFRNNAFTADIYYNRSLDAGATWLPSAIRLDHSTTITFGGSSYPRIAAAGSSVYVMYADNRNDPGLTLVSRDIYFNRSLDRGASWLPSDVRLNTSAPAGSYFTEFPDLAAAGSSVYAVWIDRRNPRTVAFNRSLDGGSTWQPTDVPISTPPANAFPTVDVPRIAASGPLLLVTWAENRSNSKFDVFINSSADAGATWLAADRRLDTGDAPGAADSFLPVPAFASTVPYVVWQDERDGQEDVFLNLPFGHLGYGTGLAGSGGIVPTLSGQGLARHGQTFTFPLTDALGGAPGVLVLGLQKADIPVLGGTLLVDALAHLWFAITGPAGVPGAGWAAQTIALPASPAFVGIGIFGQGFVFDPGATAGLAITAGLELWIG